MIESRFLDYDPITGVSRIFHWDEDNKQFHIETKQDVSSIIETNKELYKNDSYRQDGIKNEMLHKATIPESVQVKWLQEGINLYNKDHWKKVKQKLNSSEYRYLKVTAGRI